MLALNWELSSLATATIISTTHGDPRAHLYNDFSDPQPTHQRSAKPPIKMTETLAVPATTLMLSAKQDNNTTGTYIHYTFPSMPQSRRRRRRRRKGAAISEGLVTALVAMSTIQYAAAQNCIPLKGTTTCPAFASASIAMNDSYLIGLFSFLSNVTDLQSFDTYLHSYMSTGYPERYTNLFGCSNINLSNTTDLYPRYGMSFVCNSIIQNSIATCGTSAADSRPLCVDSCADFALSEQTIISSPDLCGTSGPNALIQLRADFTACSLPADSITGSCIAGYENEPSDCGYQSNLGGLCTYCNASTVNSTDSCCVSSNVTSRCSGVTLPAFVSMQPLFTSTSSSSSPSGTATGASTLAPVASNIHRGLTGGQIAGIVVGAVIGAALLLGILICCGLLLRRKKKREEMSTLNRPTPARKGEVPGMVYTGGYAHDVQPLPGSRVTRMSALESSAPPTGFLAGRTASPLHHSSSSSPRSGAALGAAAAARTAVPVRNKQTRQEGYDGSSPESTGYVSQEPPESERMESFKDYYSSDEIHPNDQVSVLWAYQPRAPDEFELERGDMIKIVGIWDDGWATGVRIPTKADEWEPRRDPQRDSGVSSHNASRSSPGSPTSNGDVKAFPLVCVCLPQHWRRTIEGDSEFPSSDSPYPS